MHIKYFSITKKKNGISFGFIGRTFVTNQLSYTYIAVGCPFIHSAMLNEFEIVGIVAKHVTKRVFISVCVCSVYSLFAYSFL